MANVFIFHGTGGYPEENWFPWLKAELESLGCKVFIPQFPTPENQTPATWFPVFNQYKEHFTEDTILIGHSLGGAFLLRVLEQSNIKIKAAFIVSAPVGVLPIKNYEGDKPFIGHPFDWVKIKENCSNFFVFHSDPDPYVSIGNGRETSKQLGTELTFVPNAGHFNTAAGFDKFELLLKKVKNVLGGARGII
ncbi:MAG: alpha/beta hydrolase [archaeon]